uniref:CNH domain-containing protein n=1 Tax=Palpitomonas bilix TaxID=652834 RepID=A0A7S3GCV9_9EUKA|mmetsp:Transcript_43824/g.114308  ORF Transcript_43824/g.114308 Transcript_43824/m.114308 type:complete len:1200 (+) Transcript_43824:226-3825(+)
MVKALALTPVVIDCEDAVVCSTLWQDPHWNTIVGACITKGGVIYCLTPGENGVLQATASFPLPLKGKEVSKFEVLEVTGDSIVFALLADAVYTSKLKRVPTSFTSGVSAAAEGEGKGEGASTGASLFFSGPVQFSQAMKTKGAADFTALVPFEGDETMAARIAYVQKKKLSIAEWKGTHFEEVFDTTMAANAELICFASPSVVSAAVKGEYSMVNPTDGNIVHLFQAARDHRPMGCRVSYNECLLAVGNTCVFVDKDGRPTREVALHLSSPPRHVCSSGPFIIAAVANGVEVRVKDTHSLLQMVPLDVFRISTSIDLSIRDGKRWEMGGREGGGEGISEGGKRGWGGMKEGKALALCVPVEHSLGKLQSLWRVPKTRLIASLLHANEYEVALALGGEGKEELTELSFKDDEFADLSSATRLDIYCRWGLHLFKKRQFEAAFAKFSLLGDKVEVRDVLRLFPFIRLPAEVKVEGEMPAAVVQGIADVKLTEAEVEKTTTAGGDGSGGGQSSSRGEKIESENRKQHSDEEEETGFDLFSDAALPRFAIAQVISVLDSAADEGGDGEEGDHFSDGRKGRRARGGEGKEKGGKEKQIKVALSLLAEYLVERRQRWLKRTAKQVLSPAAGGPVAERFSLLDTALVHCYVVISTDKVFSFVTSKNFSSHPIVEALLLSCRPRQGRGGFGASVRAPRRATTASGSSTGSGSASSTWRGGGETLRARWSALWPSLYQLYKMQKKHREALSLFLNEVEGTWLLQRGRAESIDSSGSGWRDGDGGGSVGSASSFQPLADITNYLRNLSRDRDAHPLVIEFAKPIVDAVKADQKQALKIFNSPQNTMGVDRIMDYLHRNMYHLCEPYLEHVSGFFLILQQKSVQAHSHSSTHKQEGKGVGGSRKGEDNDQHAKGGPSSGGPLPRSITSRLAKDPQVFEKLAKLYIETARRGRVEAGSKGGDDVTPAEKVGARRKLQILLASPVPYRPSFVLPALPPDDFFEEKATLCSKLGQHEKALSILVHVMQNPKKAEEYCEKHYVESEGGRDVYVALMKALMNDGMSMAGVRTSTRRRSGDDGHAHFHQGGDIPASAASLLERYYNRMDPVKVLSIVPSSALLSSPVLLKYLQNTLRKVDHERRSMQVLKQIQKSNHTQALQHLISKRSASFKVDEKTVCALCGKALGTGVVARSGAGDLCHFVCFKKIEDMVKEK